MIDAIYMVDSDHCERHFSELNPTRLSTRKDVERMSGHPGLALWIARHGVTSAWLGRAMAARSRPRRDWLLFLEAPTPTALTMLRTLFDRVVAPPATFLPLDELAEVLASDERGDLCIGGMVDPASEVVTLYRGDLRSVTVPLSLFGATPDGLAPDPAAFSVTDYGRTLAFGDYEAAFDVVLYERDSDYRRRLKEQRLAKDQGFGPSLRRLRLQRALRQSDFPGITTKTVARIERGEVETPSAKTLAILAERLGVEADQLAEF